MSARKRTLSFKTLFTALLVTVIVSTAAISCSAQKSDDSKFSDPSKKYVALIVLNSPDSAKAVDYALFQSRNDGYEPGPVYYYRPDKKDFDQTVKTITAMKQVTCIYLIGSVFDMPVIKKSAQQAGFKGEVRFLSASGAGTPVQ